MSYLGDLERRYDGPIPDEARRAAKRLDAIRLAKQRASVKADNAAVAVAQGAGTSEAA